MGARGKTAHLDEREVCSEEALRGPGGESRQIVNWTEEICACSGHGVKGTSFERIGY